MVTMVGHTLDSRVLFIYKMALDELEYESGSFRALCGEKSIERRET